MGRSEKSAPLLPYHGGAYWALMGRKRRSAKWEKENYRALPRAKHSIRLFWAKLWVLGLKRELSRGRLF